MEICRQILNQGLAELAITATDKQRENLLTFIQLLEKWNKTYNLTAIRQPQEMVRLHLLDSLAVLPYMTGQRIADIGTGAGLPGIPLALFLPDVEFVLLDSNHKKTRFVQQAILELQLKNVSVYHGRVENFKPEILFDTVISRAFTHSAEMIKLTGHLLTDNGVFLAMKGQQPQQELASINLPYTIFNLTIPQVDTERCLVKIQKGL